MANTKEKDLSWELVQWMTAPDFQAPVIDVKAKQIANVHHRPKAAMDQAVKEIETLK